MTSTIHHIAFAGALALASFGAQAVGQPASHQGTHHAAENAMSDGEIRKVDKQAGKLTIRHGELKNLGMPAMTMAFRVKEPAMLDKVKEGDKVRFVVEKLDGAFTVTRLEAVQ